MMLRKYKPCDSENVYRILQAEGISHEKMFFPEGQTYVLCDYGIIGMFSYYMHNKEPHISHFCVDKKYRSPSTARLLAKYLKGVIRGEGYTRAIIHVCKNKKGYLDKIVKYYTKQEPYAIDNDYKYYIMEV